MLNRRLPTTLLCLPALLPHPPPQPPPQPQDLESRKRAPLYQKRQEEELKAAVDKGAEAEVRAGEAELKCKEAKVRWWWVGVGGGWVRGGETGSRAGSASICMGHECLAATCSAAS